MSFKKIIIAVCCMFAFTIAAGAAGDKQNVKRVAYFGDSIVFKDTYLFTSMLQLLLDKYAGENKVHVDNYAFFDMNTAQVSELFTDNSLKPDLAIILSGEANFLNLTGFYEYYMSSRQGAAKTNFPSDISKEAVLKLNRKVASAYGVDKHGKVQDETVLSAVMKATFGLNGKDTFKPKVIPEFKLLTNPDYLESINLMARVYYYNDAWESIRNGDFSGAVKILSSFTSAGDAIDPSAYYMLGIIVLNISEPDIETALKYFTTGILLNPYDINNPCYKGLAVVYMSFKGELSAEALFFARLLRNYTLDLIPEINAITAINVINYNEKIKSINTWIEDDFKTIRRLAAINNVPVLFLDYPKDVLANVPIKDFAQAAGVPFVDNSAFLSMLDEATINSWYMAVARNTVEQIKEKNLLKLTN